MKLKLTILFLVANFALWAQKASEGENFFNSKQYAKAREVYEALLKQKPGDALYNYRYARCCYELKDFENAIVHFEMSGNKYPQRDLFLGELYFNAYRFDESVMAYQTYNATLKPDDPKIAELQRKVGKAEKAAKLLNKVEDIAILDSVVVNKNDFIRFYKSGNELGKITVEPLKLSSRKYAEKVKFTTQRKDRVYYSDSIQGQLDLFTSYKLLDSWSEPVPLSSVVNTRANENYPFLSLDGVTIYYASDGENSIGGYDIFVSRYNTSNGTYLTPENLGMPFNSPYNDYMLVVDEQRKIGWFVTDRYQQAGKVVVYTFVPNETKTIIRTEDKNYLRNAAQLKVHRNAVVTSGNNEVGLENNLPEADKKIEFVINDSVVYTNADQFKNKEALKTWTEMRGLVSELDTKKNILESLYTQYMQIDSQQERESLNILIPELEKKIIELKKQIDQKTLQARNQEIISLKNK